jgi:hypothetical protein
MPSKDMRSRDAAQFEPGTRETIAMPYGSIVEVPPAENGRHQARHQALSLRKITPGE